MGNTLESKKKGTTLWIWSNTRDRMNILKGHGISADRFLNDLMDAMFPQERKESETENEKVEPQVLGF